MSIFLDSMFLACILGLHCILKPPINKNKKYTIQDSQKSQILFIATLNNLDVEVESRTKEGFLQPYVIVLGDIINPKDFYVTINGIIYKFERFSNALDFCFKLFHIFDLQYPKPSHTVWTFIEKFFYNLNQNQKKIPKVLQLIQTLKSQK